jgi:membrane protease YdiL (CAAX protease family)
MLCGNKIRYNIFRLGGERIIVTMISGIAKLFRWQPTKETLVAFASGLLCVGMSAVGLLINNPQWASIAIRDVGQILLLGILFPLVYIQRSTNDFASFGFSFKKWPIYLSINLILGLLLFFLFISESPISKSFHLNASTLWSMAYVMLALCFELIFFYAFLRTLFERAFGIVPAIILTALFYAFHHIGFQPEYGKLIFVGLLYSITFRLGNSALLIFPFFIGVGGTYDVLIQSKVISTIFYPEIRTLYLLVVGLGIIVWTWRKASIKYIHP